MKKFIICIMAVCIFFLGIVNISCDWEEVDESTAYYYAENFFYDLNGNKIENTGYFRFNLGFDPKEYAAIKINCAVVLQDGEVQSISLQDENENIIKEWTAPITGFEEELDEDVFQKTAFTTQQASKGSQGQVTVTMYGKPKLITRIKREINYYLK